MKQIHPHHALFRLSVLGPLASRDRLDKGDLKALLRDLAGAIWYGDVMHKPNVLVDGRLRKVYLISFMDDATRIISLSAFCPDETGLEVEGAETSPTEAWIADPPVHR